MVDKDKTAQDAFTDPHSTEDLAAIYLSAISNILASLKEYEENDGGFASDVMFVLAQAQVRWLTSAMRYWIQIANIVSDQGTDMIETLQSEGKEVSPEVQRLRVLDRARATLREISDVSLSEAKLLQRDLMKVEADLRDTLGDDDDDLDAAHRFARGKK